MSKTRKTDESEIKELILPSLLGTVVGVLTSAALALILPLVLSRLKDPAGFIAPLALVSLYIGALTSGVAVRRHGAVSALISGGGFVLCLWLLSFAAKTDGDSTGLAMKLLGYALCIAVSLLGATVGKSSKSRSGEGKKSPTARLRKQLGRRQ